MHLSPVVYGNGSYSPYLKTSTSHYRAPLLLNSTDCTLKPPENRKKIGLKRRQSHQWSPCTTIRSPTFEPLEQGLQGPPVRVEERAVMVLDIVLRKSGPVNRKSTLTPKRYDEHRHGTSTNKRASRSLRPYTFERQR